MKRRSFFGAVGGFVLACLGLSNTKPQKPESRNALPVWEKPVEQLLLWNHSPAKVLFTGVKITRISPGRVMWEGRPIRQ